MNAGIYVRISADREGRGLGVARQQADCEALCAARGWAVEAVYVDNDISASKGKRRPGYGELCDDLKNHRIDAVVAYHNDRLHRSTRELNDFIELIELTGAAVAMVAGGEYDLTTATGRMAARIVGAVAQAETERLSERNRRKHLELAQKGLNSGGGTRPFGFEPDRETIRETEAAVVREVARRLVDGESLRGIAVTLDERGVATVTGTRWTQTVLRRLLLSPRVAGRRQHQGRAIGEARWPAILDEITWGRVRAILEDPARRQNTFARRYLLAGIAVCGLCDARLVARPRGDKRRCYVCARGPGFRGCGKIRSLADPLEKLVVDEMFDALDSGLIGAHAPGDDALDAALGRVAELEQRIAELAGDYYGDRTITKEQFVAGSARANALLAEAKAEAARVNRGHSSAAFTADEDLRDRWGGLSFDVRRALVVEHVEKITVASAVKGRNFFDPDRVQIRWR